MILTAIFTARCFHSSPRVGRIENSDGQRLARCLPRVSVPRSRLFVLPPFTRIPNRGNRQPGTGTVPGYGNP
eukprot:2242643-Rhodomonas_salina.1